MWTPPGKYACATKNWTKPIAKRWPFWSPEREDSPSLNVNLLFIIRSLERIGDIAKTIAATVVFLKEATDIRHGKER